MAFFALIPYKKEKIFPKWKSFSVEIFSATSSDDLTHIMVFSFTLTFVKKQAESVPGALCR